MPSVVRSVEREKLKVLVIASLRYPIAEPFAGGLESHTSVLAHGLRARGHSVFVVGATGSDPAIVDYEFGLLPTAESAERPDITNHPVVEAAETAAFAGLMAELRTGLLGSFDLVHNNSLHSMPVELAHLLPCPMVTTLHTPPLPWADRVLGPDNPRGEEFVAVSDATARSWSRFIRPQVVRNGIDITDWRAGPGGPDAVWSGRIVPEKAPHLAIDIAEAAGLKLTIAGPIIDRAYFADAIAPRLGVRVSYAGHLAQCELVTLVGHSGVALVTPVWEEPFGMVVIEAMACGTPVVALARGGVPEAVDEFSGRLLPAVLGARFSVVELGAAVTAVDEALALDREGVRACAVRRFSRSAMMRGYESVYGRAIRQGDA